MSCEPSPWEVLRWLSNRWASAAGDRRAVLAGLGPTVALVLFDSIILLTFRRQRAKGQHVWPFYVGLVSVDVYLCVSTQLFGGLNLVAKPMRLQWACRSRTNSLIAGMPFAWSYSAHLSSAAVCLLAVLDRLAAVCRPIHYRALSNHGPKVTCDKNDPCTTGQLNLLTGSVHKVKRAILAAIGVMLLVCLPTMPLAPPGNSGIQPVLSGQETYKAKSWSTANQTSTNATVGTACRAWHEPSCRGEVSSLRLIPILAMSVMPVAQVSAAILLVRRIAAVKARKRRASMPKRAVLRSSAINVNIVLEAVLSSIHLSLLLLGGMLRGMRVWSDTVDQAINLAIYGAASLTFWSNGVGLLVFCRHFRNELLEVTRLSRLNPSLEGCGLAAIAFVCLCKRCVVKLIDLLR